VGSKWAPRRFFWAWREFVPQRDDAVVSAAGLQSFL